MDNILKSMEIRRMRVRFFANAKVNVDYWIGAVLRNRFLYAAEQVICDGGFSLRRILDTLPLEDGHFLYKRLRGGFPKGYFIDCASFKRYPSGFLMEADKVYSFDVILIGNCIQYANHVEKAMEIMIAEGWGHPVTPMTLVDCRMVPESEANPKHILLNGDTSLKVELIFETPISLSESDGSGGYQSKMNDFPSFYQIVRSSAYRAFTLYLLYVDDSVICNRNQMDMIIDACIANSAKAKLLSACVKSVNRYGTPKKDRDGIYRMSGYVGQIMIGNVHESVLSLLEIGSQLGVGSHINYGFGKYSLKLL